MTRRDIVVVKVGEKPELFRLREWRNGRWQWIGLAPMTADDAVDALVALDYSVVAAHTLIDSGCHQFASTLYALHG